MMSHIKERRSKRLCQLFSCCSDYSSVWVGPHLSRGWSRCMFRFLGICWFRSGLNGKRSCRMADGVARKHVVTETEPRVL